MDDDKMTSSEAGRDPRMVTSYVASQLMRYLTLVVYSGSMGEGISLHHEVVCFNTKRLGTYRVTIELSEQTEIKSFPAEHEPNVTRVTHIFDLQMCLDLRAGWKQYVEQTVNKLMTKLYEEAII